MKLNFVWMESFKRQLSKTRHKREGRSFFLIVIFLFAFYFGSTAFGASIDFKPYPHDARQILNRVHLDSLTAFVRQFSGEELVIIDGNQSLIQDRNAGNRGSVAASYLKKRLGQYGLLVFEQFFDKDGVNIYAEQPGYLYPNQKYIICAHYDNRPWDGIEAPGADDNASGCAAVMEAARILSDFSFPFTIVYAFWDYEEYGLYGSQYYAQQAEAVADSILAVFNLDMIGYDGNNDNKCNIFYSTDHHSDQLANRMADLQNEYGLALHTQLIFQNHYGYSDHSSFWLAGYRAVLLIEDYMGGDFNPQYHKASDRIIYFNLPYFKRCCQLALLTLVDYARFAPLCFEFDLHKGWNLVSLPGVARCMAAESLFVDFDRDFILTYRNDAYINADTLESGRGYFVFTPTERKCTLALTPVPAYSSSFDNRGWHLIGALDQGIRMDQFLAIPENDFLPYAYWYDPLCNTYKWQKILEPGRGYWIFVTNPIELYAGDFQIDAAAEKSAAFAQIPDLPPWPQNALKKYTNPGSALSNYPNPFNAATTIHYHLKQESPVAIDVFNLNGERLARLENRMRAAGEYTTFWNGRNGQGQIVSSGIYLVRLITGNEIETLKITVVR
ncbi:M20/M25/M40 family metallo-hydrolase [candidate division KSB1 bacterium]|nr:M20/M25/M40 family metallo-hydrolase [candidate division KSB1 bacterium]